MDLNMSIAAMSVGLHQQRVDEQMGVAVMKMAMQSQEEMTSAMLEELGAPDVSAMTGIGGNVDMYV